MRSQALAANHTMRYVTTALCAFLLLFGIASPISADDARPLTTILLVARSELSDPNFKDSTVLVMNNIGPAPLGVIVNRPTRIAVARLFPEVEQLAPLEDKVYFGGPVDLTKVSFVFRADRKHERAIQVVDGVYFSVDRELLRKLLDRERPMEGLRIFIGHAAWGTGQLEAEIARGDWTLAPATAETIFSGKSGHPWPEKEPPDGARQI